MPPTTDPTGLPTREAHVDDATLTRAEEPPLPDFPPIEDGPVDDDETPLVDEPPATTATAPPEPSDRSLKLALELKERLERKRRKLAAGEGATT